MIIGFSETNKRTGEPTNFRELILTGSKVHTLREGDRWKEGMPIQMVTGHRTKAQETFNVDRPDLGICTGVQTVTMTTSSREFRGIDYQIIVDGRLLSETQSKELARNDGFESLYDFLSWFPMGSFTGQIIHWTSLRY
jgi:hypothetical protein